MRAISVCTDLNYLPSAAALMNSILHFQVQARIKVYDFRGLPHLVRSYLARYASLVDPPREAFGDWYLQDWNYRPRMLRDYVDPLEIQVDCDTVVLSDLETAFAEMEKGNLVLLHEWDYHHHVPDAKSRDGRQRELPAGSVFHRILRYPELHHDGLSIYNAGLVGWNRDRHGIVIEQWAETTRDHDNTEGTFFAVDQNKLALVIASLHREGRIRLFELPKQKWMQTWDEHREPRKFTGFENGRIALYNGSVDERMHFYHFTGDITAPAGIVGRDGVYPVRFNAFVSDIGLPAGLSAQQMKDSWNHVWRERHQSAAGELPMHFYSMGPVRAPKCLDGGWRGSLARLAASAAGTSGEAAGASGVHKDSKETWALALAHDYIDYCGYRAGPLGWLAEPLAALLGGRLSQNGARTVSWQEAGDVSIGFEAAYPRLRNWTSADGPEEHGWREQYSEYHQGVFLNVR